MYLRNGRALRNVVLCIAALTLTLALAACGDDDSDGKGSASGSGASQTENGKPVDVAVKYTGGKAGAADSSLDPVVIGWVNQDSGALDGSLQTAALRVAVSFVNDELGGVDGHPVKLKECPLGSSEVQGKSCAEKMLNDPAVKMVAMGDAVVGRSGFTAAMLNSKLPLTGMIPYTPDDAQAKNAYWLGGGLLAVVDHAAYYRDVIKAKSVAEIWPEGPAFAPFVEYYAGILEQLGVKVSNGLIGATTIDAVPPLIASGARKADAIGLNPAAASQCIALAKGLKQLGVTEKNTLTYSICLDKSVKQELGDFPKWTFYQDYSNVNMEDPTGEVGAFKYAIKKYRPDQYQSIVDFAYTPAYFGMLLTLTKWFNEIGPDNITPETIGSTAKAFTGPVFLAQPEGKFGSAPYPGVFAMGTRYFNYLGDGKWEDATAGKWVQPPAELLPKE